MAEKAHLLRACFRKVQKLARSKGVVDSGEIREITLTACVFLQKEMSMLDDYGFEIYENNEFPLAYLITIRTFGTWLHGDERNSVDRHGKNIYGTPDIAPSKKLADLMKEELKQPPVIFDESQRLTVEIAIKELCEERKYYLQAINVRTNHAHAVVTAQTKPERIADAFKAFATKKLREENLVANELKIWSRGKSSRYLWKPRHVELAINYVIYGQGDLLFELDDK